MGNKIAETFYAAANSLIGDVENGKSELRELYIRILKTFYPNIENVTSEL